MTPLERSTCYRGFAEAFRAPDGGMDILADDLVPPPPENAAQAFIEAFDPAVHDGGCSLYESSHVTRGQTDLYEELVRWYDHFGLKRTQTAELPDHVSVELEFMHFLTFLEIQHAGDEDVLTNLHRAQRDFLDRHLVPLAGAIVKATSARADRYGALPIALLRFLQDEHEGLLE